VALAAGASSAAPAAPKAKASPAASPVAAPASWPTGPLKSDNSHGGVSEVQEYGISHVELPFLDSTGKHHQISMKYGFDNIEIYELTFDKEPVNTAPLYRALYKYLNDAKSSLPYRAYAALQCTHPDDDNVANTDPACKGQHNPPKFASTWTKVPPAPKAAKVDYTKPANWPSGEMVLDRYSPQSEEAGSTYAIELPFLEQANGKRHHISYTFTFESAEILSLTFDGQTLDKIPQYRALAKFLQDNKLLNNRGLTVLECTHPDDDHVNQTNPDCKGWVNNPTPTASRGSSTRNNRRQHHSKPKTE
jgi:hypothetical protein